MDGRVLISGGWDFKTLIPFAATEFYDPVTNSWTATGSLHEARVFQGTTRLADGRVLAVGGIGPSNHYLTTAEIYDPATGAWTYAASPIVSRAIISRWCSFQMVKHLPPLVYQMDL